MKILYVSKLEGHQWQGPTHSVPMQIKFQSEIDEVLWVNLCKTINEEWKELPYYYEAKNELKVSLDELPKNFRKPDIVVFEGVYEYPFAKIVYEIWKRNIPYVLVPRSALTNDAQKKRHLKKIIGNVVFFNRFIYKSSSIQYLTDSEQKDSQKWNTQYFVIPNGILAKTAKKEYAILKEKLRFTYIGRIEQYQKGLDLLIEACSKISTDIRSAASIHIYGPDREDSFKLLDEEIKKNNISDIIYIHESVFGEKKENVLLNSDAFIMTSRFEGLPMGLIEALAYGLPVLITQGTNLASEVSDANAGWTTENTVEGISRMIKTAISERDKYSEKSNNAYNLSKNYDWRRISEKTHLEYKKIVDNN